MLDLFAGADTSLSAGGARLSPVLLVDLPYTPALLLDARFGAEITDHHEFADGCHYGYDSYFEDEWAEDGADHVFTWFEVEKAVVENVVRRSTLHEQFYGATSLGWRAGFMLGWLSVLSLADRGLAVRGLELLQTVVRACQLAEATLC